MIYFFDTTGRCLCRKDGYISTADSTLLATWFTEVGATSALDSSTTYDINSIYEPDSGVITEIPTKPGDNYTFDCATEAWVFNDTDALASMNHQINILLEASNWTQLRDADDTVQANWATYRQALRDLPSITTDLSDITWPTPPS